MVCGAVIRAGAIVDKFPKNAKIERYPLGVFHRGGMKTEEITNRLKRIEGQVRGLQRMVAEQRDCEAILTQLMAARAALDRVGLMVTDNFVEQCIVDAEGELSRERVRRVLDLVFSRFSLTSGGEGNAGDDPDKPTEE